MVGFLKRFAIRFARNALKAVLAFLAVVIACLIFYGMSWLFLNSVEWFWPVLIVAIIAAYSAFEASTSNFYNK